MELVLGNFDHGFCSKVMSSMHDFVQIRCLVSSWNQMYQEIGLCKDLHPIAHLIHVLFCFVGQEVCGVGPAGCEGWCWEDGSGRDHETVNRSRRNLRDRIMEQSPDGIIYSNWCISLLEFSALECLLSPQRHSSIFVVAYIVRIFDARVQSAADHDIVLTHDTSICMANASNWSISNGFMANSLINTTRYQRQPSLRILIDWGKITVKVIKRQMEW